MARLHTSLTSLTAVLLFAPATAVAAADGEPEQRTLFGQPVNDPREMTQDEIEARAEGFRALLEQQGQVLKGNQVLPKSALEPDLTQPTRPVEAWDEPVHRATTFLNFFGGPLSNGGNASEGQSPCVQGKVDYPSFKGGEQMALAIIQVFKDAAAPFGLRIAYDAVPPKHLPYSQVMMGGQPQIIGLPNGVLGVACNLDCGDGWWRDTTFAFTEETNNVGILGTVALQEAAHAWGLDHIDGENNIMYPYATPGSKVWADTCTPYNDATGGIGCKYVHVQFCPLQSPDDPGSQNDVAELTAYFGVNTPDTEAPVVKLVSPIDGQLLAAGELLHVEVEVSDNFEGYGWVMQVPELKRELQAYYGEKTWDFPGVPKGVYTIRVEALDHDGNVGFAESKIYVDQDPPAADTGDVPTTGEVDSDGGESSDTVSGSSGDTADTTAQDDDKGCSCRNDAPTPGPAWLLVVGGALMLRRRERRGG